MKNEFYWEAVDRLLYTPNRLKLLDKKLNLQEAKYFVLIF